MKKALLSLVILTSGIAANSQTLYDQTANMSTNGIIADYMTDIDTVVKCADDFIVPASGWVVTSVTVNGFRNNTGPTMDSMMVEIYSNVAGLPGATLYSDVHMLGLGGVPAPQGDTAITITIPAQTLAAGTYWIGVTGYAPGANRWNWTTTTGAAINGQAQLVDADDYFGAGATTWTGFTTLGLTEPNLAFQIGGGVVSVSEETSSTLSIYPNPVIDNLFITTDATNIEQIMIYSVNGQLVMTAATNDKTVDVSALTEGVYVLQIQTENGISTQRFVKK